jgi:hypothetical protein
MLNLVFEPILFSIISLVILLGIVIFSAKNHVNGCLTTATLLIVALALIVICIRVL